MYEYKCEHCGKRFEVLQKFSDTPLTVHEECGSGPVERLISAPAFNFKGTGWYVTDYAKGNDSKSDSSTSPAPANAKSDSKASDTKTESPSSTPATPAAPAPSAPAATSSPGKSDK